MNTKKIKLHDNNYGSQMCDPQLFQGTATGLSFHPGFMSSEQNGGVGSWPQEEYSQTPRTVLTMQGDCVGYDTAAFFATEHLLGMTRFDCPLRPMAALKTAPFGRPPEADLLYRSVDPPQLHEDSVRTYYVPSQQRDASKAPPALQLPLQQQQEQVHRLCGNASNARLLGGDPKNHSFSPHVSELYTATVKLNHGYDSPSLA